jgi:hypothetical protein
MESLVSLVFRSWKSLNVSTPIANRSTLPPTNQIDREVRIINDRQASLFDLDQYQCESLVKWGWLEEDTELGGSKNLPPNSKVRGQIKPDILPPNSKVRGQNQTLPPNLEIVKVQGRSYFLTPTKPVKPRPIERTWYEIKIQKGNPYLYLRWRAEDKKKSRCLGRIDALKYSD